MALPKMRIPDPPGKWGGMLVAGGLICPQIHILEKKPRITTRGKLAGKAPEITAGATMILNRTRWRDGLSWFSSMAWKPGTKMLHETEIVSRINFGSLGGIRKTAIT
jgi:hypothetical protein